MVRPIRCVGGRLADPDAVARPDSRWSARVHGTGMEALRDISIHPDGRQIAFNARFQHSEYWVMENLIPNP
jgi:hypothetical protein